MKNCVVIWETQEGKFHEMQADWVEAKPRALTLSKAQRRVAIIHNGQVLYRSTLAL